MDEKLRDNNGEIEIDLQRVFGAIWDRLWIIIVTAIVTAVAVFAGTFYLITPQYESSAMFYVNNNSLSVGDTSFSISQGDITASKDLVESYIVILKSRTTLNDVIDYTGVNRTYTELKNMITAASVNSTEIFEVVVTSPDPVEAENIADAIAYILPKRISSIVEGTSAKIVDTAVLASSPSSPSYTKNTILGFMLGLIAAAGIVVLREIFDITIRTEEDVAQACKHPILAAVPDMAAPSKGSYYYYSNGNKKKKSKKKSASEEENTVLIGSNISFTASEAYKLLRTKLQFSFADEQKSHVIGISSALSGEGKSLSAVNLAYSLSQLEKRVVLVDCDMRRPTLAKKLPVQNKVGLSSYLTSQSDLPGLIQKCGLKNEERAFDVIASGPNPPNPIELLSSKRMEMVLSLLRDAYDYIILDLPPVGEVSDALAVAKLTDGMLLVIRQHYCNRVALSDTIRQFEFVGAKMLGAIYNCTENGGLGYGRNYSKRYYKKYYHKYYSKYSRKYEGSYMQAKMQAEQEAEKLASVEKEKESVQLTPEEIAETLDFTLDLKWDELKDSSKAEKS